MKTVSLGIARISEVVGLEDSKIDYITVKCFSLLHYLAIIDLEFADGLLRQRNFN